MVENLALGFCCVKLDFIKLIYLSNVDIFNMNNVLYNH